MKMFSRSGGDVVGNHQCGLYAAHGLKLVMSTLAFIIEPGGHFAMRRRMFGYSHTNCRDRRQQAPRAFDIGFLLRRMGLRTVMREQRGINNCGRI